MVKLIILIVTILAEWVNSMQIISNCSQDLFYDLTLLECNSCPSNQMPTSDSYFC